MEANRTVELLLLRWLTEPLPRKRGGLFALLDCLEVAPMLLKHLGDRGKD